MNNEYKRKFFIFLIIIFLLVMIGPYLGMHLLGSPELPIRESSHEVSDTTAYVPEDPEDAMLPVPKDQFEDIMEEEETDDITIDEE